MTSDFGAGDGVPFVAGSIRGHRIWTFKNGRLWSPQQNWPWDGPEQDSVCRIDDGISDKEFRYRQSCILEAADSFIPEGMYFLDYKADPIKNTVTLFWNSDSWLPFDRDSRPKLPEQTCTLKYEVKPYEYDHHFRSNNAYSMYRTETETHFKVSGWTLVDIEEFTDAYEAAKTSRQKPSHFPDCACGFYAYYDHRTPNAYIKDNTNIVSGIVEGYGETVIGTTGFRSQKMKILALSSSEVGLNDLKSLNLEGVELFKKTHQMNAAFPVSPPEEVRSILDSAA